MCTLAELNKALADNNLKRDHNLDQKLSSLREDFFAHVSKVMEHTRTSPETKTFLDQMKETCLKTTNKYNLNQQAMKDDIENISSKQGEILAEIKEIRQNFVSTIEFQPVKDKVNKLVGFIWALLIGCGLIVAYWVLRDAGIPTP